MQTSGETEPAVASPSRRTQYQQALQSLRRAFENGSGGYATVRARASLLDEELRLLWPALSGPLADRFALVAVGGYGRGELFPYSDVDLLFLVDPKLAEADAQGPVQQMTAALWDLGVRASPQTRKPAECARLDPEAPEFSISLLDHRYLAGSATLYAKFHSETIPRLVSRDGRAIQATLRAMTRERHAKFGNTPFQLEPNVKDCPGGLRDVHVCRWMAMLGQPSHEAAEFIQATEFLAELRCFLHYRHERDDNALNWRAQDEAAAVSLGVPAVRDPSSVSPAYWMRLYFRHARSVERRLAQLVDAVPGSRNPFSRLRLLGLRQRSEAPSQGFRVVKGRLSFDPPGSSAEGFFDPCTDGETVWRALIEVAEQGARLDFESEERLSLALPELSSHLEEGAALWRQLSAILNGPFAAQALRSMHAIGLLELLIPEFHGIDALVIRDAYHRYTVDEHTFVLIETLHGLRSQESLRSTEWTAKFSAMMAELAHSELLFLAALLHDTGKARSAGSHATESVLLAAGVVARLELDPYERDLVLGLIGQHLEMSATLRRDIFDAETVRAFAVKVADPQALRMLTLFTYADINAVHPDALTPWKVENLWRLFMATSNYLDRNMDDERVPADGQANLVYRVLAGTEGAPGSMAAFLEGFPGRYLQTRSTEQVRTHFAMAQLFSEDEVQIEVRHAARLSEITLVTRDRPLLFADLAGALAAWGMNIVSADAFSNHSGTVVDTLRFVDSFRTLEMNASEHERFRQSVHDVIAGTVVIEKLLQGRRSPRPAARIVVEPRVEIDNEASGQSTLLQVVAQDAPGLLRDLSLCFAQCGCNIEVALVDTEGETAVDVFYLTRHGHKLRIDEAEAVRSALLAGLRTPVADQLPVQQPLEAKGHPNVL